MRFLGVKLLDKLAYPPIVHLICVLARHIQNKAQFSVQFHPAFQRRRIAEGEERLKEEMR